MPKRSRSPARRRRRIGRRNIAHGPLTWAWEGSKAVAKLGYKLYDKLYLQPHIQEDIKNNEKRSEEYRQKKEQENQERIAKQNAESKKRQDEKIQKQANDLLTRAKKGYDKDTNTINLGTFELPDLKHGVTTMQVLRVIPRKQLEKMMEGSRYRPVPKRAHGRRRIRRSKR